MDYVYNPRPNERVFENKPGEVWHRAGDDKRRAAMLAFARAERDRQRNDPDAIAEREKAFEKSQAGACQGRVNNAEAALQDLRNHDTSLRAQHDRAIQRTKSADLEDVSANLLEAARLSKLLGQMPAVLASAEADLAAAVASLKRFDEGATARAAQRAVDAEKATRRAALEARADAAAQALYDKMIAEGSNDVQ